MASSVNTGSTVSHHFASKVVITVQTFVILSLTYWIVEEYLNNMYLREYVSGVFQADGLMFGILGTVLMLGSLSSLMLLRRRHGEKRFGAVSLEITSSAPKIKLAGETNTKPPEASTKPNMDFHPVVAALMADMADRRSSFGSRTGTGNEQPTKGPAPSVEVSKTSVVDQPTPTRQAPMTGPKPGQPGAPFPQTPLHDLRPQAPTSPRPEQVGGALTQRPTPVLKSQEPTGSSVLQPPQPPAPQIPTNVTTVITGIMPVQKKKDPAATPEEKPFSSQ